MKVLTPRIHGYLDYMVVVVFLLAPLIFGLSGLPAVVSYLLAAVHLMLTLLTAFPPGVARVIPVSVHGALELVVSIALIVVPLLLGFLGSTPDAPARTFYVGMGLIIFIVWLITRYEDA